MIQPIGSVVATATFAAILAPIPARVRPRRASRAGIRSGGWRAGRGLFH
jgi:hypothetical protein